MTFCFDVYNFLNQSMFSPTSSPTTSRASYTVLKKLEVIEMYYANGSNLAVTSRQVRIDKSMISRRLMNQNELKAHSGSPRQRRIFVESRGHFPEIETKLKHWIVSERSCKRSISNENVQNKALEIASVEGTGDRSFVASNGWLDNFKR